MNYGSVNIVGPFSLNGSNFPFPSGQPVGYALIVSGNALTYGPTVASSVFSGTTSNVPEGSNLYYTDVRAVNAATGVFPRSYINISGLNVNGAGSTPFQINNGSQVLKVDNIGYLAVGAGVVGSRSGFMEVGSTSNNYQGGRFGSSYVGTFKVNTPIAGLYASMGHYLQSDTGFNYISDFLGKAYINTASTTIFTYAGLPSGTATGFNGLDIARINNFGMVIASGCTNTPNTHTLRVEQGLNNSGVLGLYTDLPNALEVRSKSGTLKAKIDSNGQPTFGNVNIPTSIGTSGQVLISNGSTVSFGSPVTQLRILVDENGGADFTSLSNALNFASGIATANKVVQVDLNSDIGISTNLGSTIDMTNPAFAYVNIDGKNHRIVSKVTQSLFKANNGINLSNVTLSWGQQGLDLNSILALNSASGVAIELVANNLGNSSTKMSNITIQNFGVGIKMVTDPTYDYGATAVADFVNMNNFIFYNNIIAISGVATPANGLKRFVNMNNIFIDSSVFAAYIQNEDTVGILSSGMYLNITNLQVDCKYGLRTLAGKLVSSNLIAGCGEGSVGTLLQTYNDSVNALSNITLGNDCTIVDAYDNSTTRFNSFGVNNTNPIFKQNNSAVVYAQLDNCTYNPTISNSGNVYAYGVTPGGAFKVGLFTLPSSIGNSGLQLKSDGHGGSFWG